MKPHKQEVAAVDPNGSSETLFLWTRADWNWRQKSLRGRNYMSGSALAWVTTTPSAKGKRKAVDKITVNYFGGIDDSKTVKKRAIVKAFEKQSGSGLGPGGMLEAIIYPSRVCVSATFVIYGKTFSLKKRCVPSEI
jgi:hypothetical protein